MFEKKGIMKWLAASAIATGLVLAGTTSAWAHCDTMSGPVITAARNALETGNADLVLIWVQPGDEAVIREELDRARSARSAGGEARQAADQRFFETLVRIHRTGEGAPYTGIKPAGTEIDPAVAAADQALATGTDGPVRTLLVSAVEAGIEKQFRAVTDLESYEPDDVAAGRAYVAAYVQYTHFAEGLYGKATAVSAHHGPGGDGHASGHETHGTGSVGAHAGHAGHAQHLPWLLALVLGLTVVGETAWILRRKSETRRTAG